MKSKIIWIVVAMVVVGGLVWMNKAKGPATSGEVIKIGAALALSGDAAVWGEASLNGAKLAVEEINNKGGIKGKKIELIVEDMKSTSKDSVSAVSKLQNIDKVNALLVSWVDVYQGAESIVKPNTILISPDAGVEAINGEKLHENVFSTWYRTQPKSDLSVKYMSEVGKKKLHILVQNDSYYLSVVKFMEEAAKKYGVEVVGKDLINPGTDLRTTLTKISAEKPDVVFVGLYDEKQTLDFLKNHSSLLNKDIMIFGEELIDQNRVRPDYDKSWFEGIYYYGPRKPDASFFNLYKSTYGKEPVFGAAPTYDSVYMLAKMFNDNPTDISHYMRNTKFDTVSYGQVMFDDLNGITAPVNYFVINKIEAGIPVQVK